MFVGLRVSTWPPRPAKKDAWHRLFGVTAESVTASMIISDRHLDALHLRDYLVIEIRESEKRLESSILVCRAREEARKASPWTVPCPTVRTSE
jgi:hypothetical protein